MAQETIKAFQLDTGSSAGQVLALDASANLSLTSTNADFAALTVNSNSVLHAGTSGAFSATSADVDFNSVAVNANPVLHSGTTGAFSATSADVDFNSVAVNGTSAALAPGLSSNPALALDTWRNPSSTNPVSVTVACSAQTDGTTNGNVSFAVDESGGTTADYTAEIAYADSTLGAGVTVNATTTFTVPAGGAYQISNVADPNAVNAITVHREFVW